MRLLYPPPASSAFATEETQEEGPGSPGWVTVRENGLTYSFDFTRVMFSSGNISEKERCVRHVMAVCVCHQPDVGGEASTTHT